MRRGVLRSLALLLSAVGCLLGAAAADRNAAAAGLSPGEAANTARPAAPVKLVFVHHSTGEAWLADGHGRLGIALRDNNYFVSDTNYDWGPGSIGSVTDIGHWYTWFRDAARSPAAMAALYAESGRHCSYSRLAADPGGPNEIVLFKSCFPNSDLGGSASAAIPPIASNPLRGQDCYGASFTVANAKGIYRDLLGYFAAHQDKLFVAIVAPPILSPGTPANGRAMADWLVNDWLDGYAHDNVFVWDFYNVLTSETASGRSDVGLASGNHHRVWSGVVQHKTNDGVNRLVYDSGGDDHPNAAGDRKATAEFVPLLNAAYNAWTQDTMRAVVTPTANAAGWLRRSATVTLRAGASVVEYRHRGDVVWTAYTAPFEVTAQGATTYEIRARDGSGEPGSIETVTVRIDSGKPKPRLLRNATVRRGARVAVAYRVDDAVSPRAATVQLRIYRGRKLVKRVTVRRAAVGQARKCRFRCTLPRGRYRLKVRAVDLAGNACTWSGSKTLRVR